MPIKKSSLEQKWYYRMAKVLFLILPLILIILFLLNKKTITCDVLPISVLDILLKDVVYIIVGLILYYLLLTVIWKCFLYIVFGGLEDDTKTKTPQPIDSDNQPTPARPRPNKIVQWIAILIILGAFAVLILSKLGYISSNKIVPDNFTTPDKKPIPGYSCPVTSAQTSTPCHSVKNGIGTSGVIVPDKCQCPEDTTFAQMDNITQGGPYKICKCK